MPCCRIDQRLSEARPVTVLLVGFAGVVISSCTYAMGKHLVDVYKTVPWSMKILSCLNSNVAMTFGVLLMELHEGKGDADR